MVVKLTRFVREAPPSDFRTAIRIDLRLVGFDPSFWLFQFVTFEFTALAESLLRLLGSSGHRNHICTACYRERIFSDCIAGMALEMLSPFDQNYTAFAQLLNGVAVVA